VWLDGSMTSPYAFYQFFLNAEDAKVIDYVKVFCERSREEIQELERLTVEQPERRAAQRVLADVVTALVHSPADRDAAAAAADALFGRSDLSALPATVMASVAAELNAARLDGGDALPTVVTCSNTAAWSPADRRRGGRSSREGRT